MPPPNNHNATTSEAKQPSTGVSHHLRMSCLSLFTRISRRLAYVVILAGITASSLYAAPDYNQLLAKLGAEDYSVRQAAHAELKQHFDQNPRKMLKAIPPLLVERWLDDPEVASRAESLLETAYIGGSKPYLGLSYRPVNLNLPNHGQYKAMKVTRLKADSPAKNNGIRTGDFILSFDNKRLDTDLSKAEIKNRLLSLRPNSDVVFTVYRNEKILRIKVHLTQKQLSKEELARQRKKFRQWFYKVTARPHPTPPMP